jgi:hypothetical protein
MRVMELPPHKPGYWWVNVAQIAQKPVWVEQVAPAIADDRLFGYDRDEFMAKQYRKKVA